MHDEMLAFKRQVADAEAKSRADRKVRPINSACSCELDMLPQACCQETQYVPQHFEASAGLSFCSAVLYIDAVDVAEGSFGRITAQSFRETALRPSCFAVTCCTVLNG